MGFTIPTEALQDLFVLIVNLMILVIFIKVIVKVLEGVEKAIPAS